nr:nitrogen assimilation transcription factor nit-4 [Quercus suber]
MPPRPLRPKDDFAAPDSTDAVSDSKLNKRRACDGNLPSCSTCIAVYRTECFYDESGEQQRKGAGKRSVPRLQQQNDSLDVIVASLKGLPEREALALLQGLRNGSDPDSLAASLRADVRSPHDATPVALKLDPSHTVPSTQADESLFSPSRSREQSTSEPSVDASQNYPPPYWSQTEQDPEFVEHLLNLYFTWIHPFYHFFSRDHFLHDMGQGRTENCSAMLVNAVMAVSCHYSDRPSARSNPHNPATAGDFYFTEAKRLLDGSDKSCLTTVQTLLVMACRECSQGRESAAYRLLGRAGRMALELGLHLSVMSNGLRPHEIEIRKITFWAVFNLESTCAVGFGRLSQVPRVGTDLPKPMVNDRLESQTWRPYEDTNVAVSPSAEQAARSMLFVEKYSTLCEIACEMVNTYYAPQESFTNQKLIAQYAQYQEWYRNLPDAFRLENTSLPYVLVLHMMYYACILHLFRPFIKLDLRNVNLYPVDIVTYCANQISSLMNALRAMYGLRRVALAVPNMLLSAATIHLLNLPAEPAASHLSQGLHDLQAMAVNHQFAAQCVEIIRTLAVKWNIELPEGANANNVFRGAHPPPMSPPHVSTFFAASIPRTNSSDTGAQSSGTGNHQSPFPPPPASDQRIQFSRSHSDPTMTPDLSQSHNMYWIPFPAQGMPINQRPAFNTFDTGYSSMRGEQHWHLSDGTEPHHGTPDSIEDSVSNDLGLGDWRWQ